MGGACVDLEGVDPLGGPLSAPSVRHVLITVNQTSVTANQSAKTRGKTLYAKKNALQGDGSLGKAGARWTTREGFTKHRGGGKETGKKKERKKQAAVLRAKQQIKKRKIQIKRQVKRAGSVRIIMSPLPRPIYYNPYSHIMSRRGRGI